MPKTLPHNNTLWPFAHKRLSYQHEREVRAVTPVKEPPSKPPGRYVPVDLSKFVQNVYVAPESPD